MQSQNEFLSEFWDRLASQISESPYSDRELSKLCGKGPNYINTATERLPVDAGRIADVLFKILNRRLDLAGGNGCKVSGVAPLQPSHREK